MRGLLLRSLGVLVLIALLLAALAAQTGSRNPANKPASSNTWTPPLAPDGHPDLQGVWLVNTATPLERPKELEGREQLTDEEVAELKRRADRIFKNGDSDFAAGDNLFLAALRNVEHYGTGTTATENSVGMIEREFDNRTSLVIEPIDGRIPPLTDEARRRQAAARGTGQHPAGPEDFSNAYRCITTGVPKLGGLYGAGHFSYYEIIQTRQYIVLETETIHDARIIPLDGRPHLPESVRQWNGDSRARWEGKVLVVDTTNFSPKSNFMGSTDHLHLVERFTRVAANTISYEITIDDTTTWTKPWTAVLPLKQTSGQMYEFACHEGNQIIMRGMLAAARADESAETREKVGTKPR